MLKDRIDILIGLPSHKEEDSIRNVVQKVDLGLTKYFSSFKSLIVNVDSNSEDNTRSVFLESSTKNQKYSVSGGKSPKGKGMNILKLLELNKRFKAKYIALFDTDLLTITEDWPRLLLDPLLKREANFVTPRYTRNRYEGNTTNHFCYPLITTWFGKVVRQPIAGDFGMDGRFADYILRQRIPFSAKLYGIDIFLTTHAIGGEFKTKEIYLGRKIHKSSFEKIVPMFQQVVASAIYAIATYKHLFHRRININDIKKQIFKNQNWVDEFVRKPNSENISKTREMALSLLSDLSISEIRDFIDISESDIYNIQNEELRIRTGEWVKILTSIIRYVLEHTISEKEAEQIAKVSLPFFLLRVLYYVEEIDGKSPLDVEKIINNQVVKLLEFNQ